jgi:DNA-binding PucR family transcriptional regulator
VALELVSDDPVEEELYRERLIDLVGMYSEAFRLRISWVAIGKTAYGLMPVDDDGDRARVMNIVRRLHEHARSTLEVSVIAAVSSTVTHIRDVSEARREAERILRVLSQGEATRDVASIEEVRTDVTLLILQDTVEKNPDLMRGPVAEIATHDRDKGSVYFDTLRAYLEAFGDIPIAAERLSVHPNTFRYRLRRLIEIFDVDIDDPDTRLLLHLQLRLMTPKPGS